MPDNAARLRVPVIAAWLADECRARTPMGRARPWIAFTPGEEDASIVQAARVLADHAALNAASAFSVVGETLDGFLDPSGSIARASENSADTTDYFRLSKFVADAYLLQQRLPREQFTMSAALHAGMETVRALLEPHRNAHGFTIAPQSDPQIAAAASAYAAAERHVRDLRKSRYRELDAMGLPAAHDDRNILLRADAQALQAPELREKIRIIEESPAFLIWDIRADDELVAAETRCADALSVYDAANARALERLGAQLRPHLGLLEELSHWIAECDHRLVCAAIVERYGEPFCIPEIALPGELLVSGARFLPLERECGAAYTPVDMQAHGPVVITGAHMGGKTSALYALAMVAACMQRGLPVPAERVRMRIYAATVLLPPPETAYAGWSSFGAEMRGVADLCAEERGEPRLVLCDEFARSTNAAEGRALAIAFLRYLAARGDDVVAVTHVDGIAEAVPAERYQAGGDFSDTSDTMDYRLRRVDAGEALGSRAFATARAAGVPAAIVDAAARLMQRP